MKLSYSQQFDRYVVSDKRRILHMVVDFNDAQRLAGLEPAEPEEDYSEETLSNFIVRSWEEGYNKSEILMGVEREYGAEHCELAEEIVDKLQVQFNQREAQEKTTMIRPIEYFCGDGDVDPAIVQFAQEFQNGDNTLALEANDQGALLAVLGVHFWGCYSGLEDDFWANVESAIGDGVETSLEETDCDYNSNAPIAIALNILQHINYESCQSLIAYLVQ